MSDPRRPIDMTAPARPRGPLPRNDAPIVPPDSVGGRALVAVVAIMTFLASLTTGAVLLVRASAGEWQSEVSREVTIQVRPVSGRVLEEEVQKAVELARSVPGISEVRPFSRQESARLLEPWLGSGIALEDLPVPRVIVLKLSSDAQVCADNCPYGCGAGASTTIAAGSTGCERWGGPPWWAAASCCCWFSPPRCCR